MTDHPISENRANVTGFYSGEFKPRFSVVIPAFNEETRIEKTLLKWIDFLDYFYPGEYEILVIMDGCTDKTVDVVSRFANEHVISLVYSERLGKGGALIEAFKHSRSDVIFFTDADGSLNVNEFMSFVDVIEFADLIIGCRYFKGSNFVVNLNLGRLVLSRVFNGLAQLLLPELRGFRDTQCGAKAVRRAVISYVGKDLFITDFAFDVNLIYSALRRGLRVKEIPVDYNHVEKESKVSRSLFKTSFGMFLSIIRLRLYYSRLRKLVFSDGVLKRLIGFLMRIVS